MHKNAIKHLWVQFTITQAQPRLRPKTAFEMISTMEGLEILAIFVAISDQLCDFQSSWTGANRTELWRIADQTLENIRKCEVWKMIKGLRERKLQEFWSLQEDYKRGWSKSQGKIVRMRGEDERWEAVADEVAEMVMGEHSG